MTRLVPSAPIVIPWGIWSETIVENAKKLCISPNGYICGSEVFKCLKALKTKSLVIF